MKLFKISPKELIILILLSAPVGIFLFLSNSSKINYEIKARRGYATIENFCENYKFENINLQKEGNLELIAQKIYINIKNYQDLRFKGKIKVSVRNDTDIYTISIRGKVAEEALMIDVANRILQDISDSELLRFNNIFKAVKLHCKSGVFPVFRMVPMEKVEIEFPTVRVYKYSYLSFLALLPLAILYLLLVSFKYIKNIKNIKN